MLLRVGDVSHVAQEMTLSLMVPSFGTIAAGLCLLSLHGTAVVVDAFLVAPAASKPTSATSSLALASTTTPIGSLHREASDSSMSGACRWGSGSSDGSAFPIQHYSWAVGRNGQSWGGGGRQRLTSMAASSRINGADVSQDLSQLNGADVGTAPSETPNAQRVRIVQTNVICSSL